MGTWTSVSDIHRLPQSVYRDDVMSRQTVGRWCSMFNEGRQSVEDEERFVACDWGDWITQPTAPILPRQTFTFFPH
ncbi:hypothetical protein AVEN_58195-1 [Araneus ventricosus]|uniref:Mos1 transposase HTH domain-containing protein n=1 Tax=Araneus ventricosus TaxID=182803 RepID=A0A4Y2RCY7_ARAVE|nr:hypothetical protein AVEN_58195-1 [Araneus ventricosus]